MDQNIRKIIFLHFVKLIIKIFYYYYDEHEGDLIEDLKPLKKMKIYVLHLFLMQELVIVN